MRTVEDLMAFISASPSPYHAVAEAARRLTEAGFTELDLRAGWPAEPGSYFVTEGGGLVAWRSPDDVVRSGRFLLVGAHTDSPNLRVKPRPDTGGFGWKQLAVEVYGGALWNSWLDRDLGLSGRVAIQQETAPVLVRVDDPLLRIPQLAIHLDRDVNGQGLQLNPQHHLTPVWGTGAPQEGELRDFLVELLARDGHEVDVDDIRGWDLMVHDLTPPARLGRADDLLAAPRLDNLLSCWAAVDALLAAPAGSGAVPVICLFDHEEVGSGSATGASGPLLEHVLERIVLARGGDRADHLRALAGSMCLSADAAHATHPNYPERHDPGHHVLVNGGPVVKVNVNQRYATESRTSNALLEAFERAGSPQQWFVSRNDQPCGSTIGPLTATRLGIATIDVGVAQLSMHSARELCGVEDVPRFAGLMEAFFGLGDAYS